MSYRRSRTKDLYFYLPFNAWIRDYLDKGWTKYFCRDYKIAPSLLKKYANGSIQPSPKHLDLFHRFVKETLYADQATPADDYFFWSEPFVTAILRAYYAFVEWQNYRDAHLFWAGVCQTLGEAVNLPDPYSHLA